MNKFIFSLLTAPLGLPIHPFWEYVILFILGLIAFKMAWEASPGGTWGSAIHWIVRALAFFVLWASVYGVIWVAKWMFANWILVLCVLGAVILFGGFATILVARKRHRSKL